MVLGHSLLWAYVAKHIQLLLIFSTHTFFLSGCAVEIRGFSDSGAMLVAPELQIAVVLITIKAWLNPSKELRLRIVGLQTTKRGGDPRFTKNWHAKLQVTNPHFCFSPSCLTRSSNPICSSGLCDMSAVLPAAGRIFVTCWPLTATKSGK